MLAPAPARFDVLDALRGAAILWMTAFHFAFDLNHFGYYAANFYTDALWTYQRACIVGLFLFCAGLGQAVALYQAQSWSRFWRRWRQVALAALLVSAGSYAMYPQSFIYFGVLHGIALMLLIVRWAVPPRVRTRWLWLLGLLPWTLYWAAPLLHQLWPQLEFLNTPWFNWLGLIARKPITEDYVPLLPWLGVLLWGVAAGLWLLRQRPHWLTVGLPAALRPLALLGRWSLSYYLLHQPVLLGLLWVLVTLR